MRGRSDPPVRERNWWLLFVVMCLVLATAFKQFIYNPLFHGRPMKPGDPPPEASAADARKAGVWICDVALDPQIAGCEAWMEKVVEDDFVLAWFPHRSTLGWRVCLRVPHERARILKGPPISYSGADFTYVQNVQIGDY